MKRHELRVHRAVRMWAFLVALIGLTAVVPATWFYECEQYPVERIDQPCITVGPDCNDRYCKVETYLDWRCKYNFFAQCNLEHNAWALATLSTYACTYSAGFGCVCPNNLGAEQGSSSVLSG